MHAVSTNQTAGFLHSDNNGNTPGYRSTVKYKNYMNISRTEHQFCPPKKNKCQGLFCGKKSLSFGGNI